MQNVDDTALVLGVAAWDGLRWDSIGNRINFWEGSNSVYGVQWFIRYSNELYAVGSFSNYDPIDARWVYGMARYNEEQLRWKAITNCVLDINNNLYLLGPREPTNLLYVSGFPDTLCGPDFGNIFSFDGDLFQKWEPFDEIPLATSNYVASVFTFLGKTYITGSFQSPMGSGWLSMLRYNGTSWEDVPGWNTMGPVKDFTIWNDTLIVCGSFHQNQGAPGNLVASFDGETWNDLGSGLSYTDQISAVATDVLHWGNDLYVCGQFNNAGGITVDRLAKWNGRQWCRLPGNFSNYGLLNEMAVWRDSLYICGAFVTIDGDTMNSIAQWIGGDAVEECTSPVGIGSHRNPHAFTLSPNPTSGQLTLGQLPPSANNVEVRDLTGRLVFRKALAGQTLDVGQLATGTYLLRVRDVQGISLGTRRFMRE